MRKPLAAALPDIAGGFVAPLAAAFVVVLVAMAVAAPVSSVGADGIALRHAAQGAWRCAAPI